MLFNLHCQSKSRHLLACCFCHLSLSPPCGYSYYNLCIYCSQITFMYISHHMRWGLAETAMHLVVLPNSSWIRLRVALVCSFAKWLGFLLNFWVVTLRRPRPSMHFILPIIMLHMKSCRPSYMPTCQPGGKLANKGVANSGFRFLRSSSNPYTDSCGLCNVKRDDGVIVDSRFQASSCHGEWISERRHG